MGFAQTNVKHLFATPLVINNFAPDVYVPLNAELKKTVMERRSKAQSVAVSNVGGWQSDHKIVEWGGQPVQTVLSSIREVLKQITLHMEGMAYDRADIDWKINGWANINGSGHSNAMHTHPGAYWSAVYYVQVNNSDDVDKPAGGELKLFDPRGPLPLMYCPILRFGIKDYTSAGTAELHKPQDGQCVIFPSWLNHSVQPHTGTGERISLAFNFSV